MSEGEGDGWCLTGVKLVLNTRGVGLGWWAWGFNKRVGFWWFVFGFGFGLVLLRVRLVCLLINHKDQKCN